MEGSHPPRRIIPFLGPVYDALSPVVELVLRVVAGAWLLPHGWAKLHDLGIANSMKMLASMGFPPFFGAVSIALELVGGGLLILGLLTRPLAAALMVEMASITFGYYWSHGFMDTGRAVGWEFTGMWAFVFLFFAVRGGGRYSLDRAIGWEF